MTDKTVKDAEFIDVPVPSTTPEINTIDLAAGDGFLCVHFPKDSTIPTVIVDKIDSNKLASVVASVVKLAIGIHPRNADICRIMINDIETAIMQEQLKAKQTETPAGSPKQEAVSPNA